MQMYFFFQTVQFDEKGKKNKKISLSTKQNKIKQNKELNAQ